MYSLIPISPTGVILLFSLLYNCMVPTSPPKPDDFKNYHIGLEELIKGPVWISVSKSKFTLSVWEGEKLIKEYPVVFGGNPHDDKRMEGDKCTPEGDFGIVNKYPHAKWTYFIWINYPTAQSKLKHARSKRNGEIPKDAAIGGEIGIHGVPEGEDYLIWSRVNWTLGCVSLTNKDITDLYPHVKSNTLIKIAP